MQVSPSLADQAVQVEHTDTLHRLMLRSLAVYPFGGLLLVVTLWNVHSHRQLLAWLALTLLVVGLRVISIRRYQRAAVVFEDLDGWRRVAMLLAFATGAMLGASAVAFVDPAEPLSILVVAGIIMGATSGAIASLYPFQPAYWSFVLPSMGTLIVVLLVHAEPATLVVAVVCVLMQGTNIATSLTLFRAVDTSLHISHENQALLHQAQQANTAKTRFLAAASHDLRQPLHALGLFFEALTGEQHTARSRTLLGRIKETLGSVGTMLTSILDISKLDAGVVKPMLVRVELHALFDCLQQEFAPVAAENRNQLRFRPTRLMVRSDPLMLERVLRNLVANACRYTHDGRILVVARRRGNQVRCEVHDTGVGISTEQQQSVFEEFYQVDNPERDRNRGMGLGLAIVKRNAALLQHPLEMRSVPGCGSCFAVSVPLLDVTPLPAPAADGIDLSTGVAGVTVLLVDDDTIVVSAMAALLEAWGCRVLTAESIASAHAALDEGSSVPQLLIVDYRLRQGVTGVQVIDSIKQRLGAALPVVIITGDTAPERLREADAAGYPLLHKPVDPHGLMTTMRQLLDQSLDR